METVTGSWSPFFAISSSFRRISLWILGSLIHEFTGCQREVWPFCQKLPPRVFVWLQVGQN